MSLTIPPVISTGNEKKGTIQLMFASGGPAGGKTIKKFDKQVLMSVLLDSKGMQPERFAACHGVAEGEDGSFFQKATRRRQTE